MFHSVLQKYVTVTALAAQTLENIEWGDLWKLKWKHTSYLIQTKTNLFSLTYWLYLQFILFILHSNSVNRILDTLILCTHTSLDGDFLVFVSEQEVHFSVVWQSVTHLPIVSVKERNNTVCVRTHTHTHSPLIELPLWPDTDTDHTGYRAHMRVQLSTLPTLDICTPSHKHSPLAGRVNTSILKEKHTRVMTSKNKSLPDERKWI